MNRSKIEWTDYTWNPVTGCLNNCSYCYARRFAERGLGEYGKHPKGERFKPRVHPERLDEPAKLKKPSKIFVCSMGELFGEWVSNQWTMDIVRAMFEARQHTYQLLTKNPARMQSWWKTSGFNDLDIWWGVTVTNQDELWRATKCLLDIYSGKRFISFEPLLGPIEIPDVVADFLDWVIIGRMTGPGSYKHISAYETEWVADIKHWCDEYKIPVFIKDNVGLGPRCQKFPGGE